MNQLSRDFIRGLWNDHPVFRLLVGLCPALAVTTNVENGMGMGLATTFVLVCSSMFVSLLKNVIPSRVRIPCYIIVIATFVTIVDLIMNAFTPDLHRVLGLFIPLIVCNCLVLGRSEAYASKMPVSSSIVDAFGMGLGFTWSLMALGGVRELLGSGSLFGFQLLGEGFTPWGIMTLPPGAFLSIGFLVALVNMISTRWRKQSQKEA